MADRSDDRPYEIGYGKPPKAHQFRKGQSGNPRGRPKSARGVGPLLDEALAQTITITEGGRSKRISKREALILALITKAIKGDMRAAAQTFRLIETYDDAAAQGTGGLTVNVIDQFDDPE